jgi:hypothetical protein
MGRLGGSTGISMGIAGCAIHDQIPTHHIDLFKIVMDKGFGGKGPRVKAEQPGAASRFLLFIHVTGQNFLFDALRIPWWRFPPLIHIYCDKLQMRFGQMRSPPCGHRTASIVPGDYLEGPDLRDNPSLLQLHFPSFGFLGGGMDIRLCNSATDDPVMSKTKKCFR